VRYLYFADILFLLLLFINSGKTLPSYASLKKDESTGVFPIIISECLIAIVLLQQRSSLRLAPKRTKGSNGTCHNYIVFLFHGKSKKTQIKIFKIKLNLNKMLDQPIMNKVQGLDLTKYLDC
jgi:hypothetical protein